MNLNDMSGDVLGMIYSFLNYQNQRNLVIISKSINNEMKPHRYFKLTNASSMKYCQDPSFREMILNAVVHPNKQIAIYFCGRKISRNDILLTSNIHALKLNYCDFEEDSIYLSWTVSSAMLFNCHLVDYSMFGGLDTLNLQYCTSLRDVSSIKSVRTLTIAACRNVSDVSALGSVHSLTLIQLYNIVDVSALKTVHKLHIIYCSSVRDISALVNVPHFVFI
jgi:hypothetical protein